MKIEFPKKKRKDQTVENGLEAQAFQRRAKKLYAMGVCACLTIAATAVPALADGDALTAINNLSDFIFSLIRAIGIILLGYGILQVGLSFQSHDPSQRSNGILTIAGGVVIVFTKEILNLITGAGG